MVMPNGQSILVKCEVKSRGGDVFDMIVAHSNLMEHFYFGLAYIDGKEVLHEILCGGSGYVFILEIIHYLS